MSRSQLRLICFSCCVIAASFFFGVANAENPMLTRQLQETIAKARTDGTLDARTHAAERLAELTRKVDPDDVDDKTLAEMVSLLDSPDDSVRAWVAVSLGYLGPRAKSAIPKLVSVLPKADCLYVSLSSAPAIRLAITRMGGTPPPPPYCGPAKQ
jgi:hypothetical protein